jgi:hypothetical protein
MGRTARSEWLAADRVVGHDSRIGEIDTHPGVIDVALGCLASDHGAVPRAHMVWDDRAHWVELDDRLPRFGGKSGQEPR